MNVYVTFVKKGYYDEEIEKVFSSESLAQDWIIDSRFDRPIYHNKERHELEEEALGLIEEHEIV